MHTGHHVTQKLNSFFHNQYYITSFSLFSFTWFSDMYVCMHIYVCIYEYIENSMHAYNGFGSYPHLPPPLRFPCFHSSQLWVFFFLSCNPLVQLYYPYIHGCGAMCWNMLNIPGAALLKKTDSLCPRRHQLSTAPQLMTPDPPCGYWSGEGLVHATAAAVECINTVLLLCPEDTAETAFLDASHRNETYSHSKNSYE